MPGASELEDAWLRARLGEPDDRGAVYLTGKDAEVAACDALTVPVVTGHGDMAAIDKIIALASASTVSVGTPSTDALQAHRYAIARLAIDFVSGPAGLASALRRGLLEHPYSTQSLPLDIGFSDSIPAQYPPARVTLAGPALRVARRMRPARLQPRTCTTSGTSATAARHRSINCGLFCEFHHENLHPSLGLGGHPPPRRHHGSPQSRWQPGSPKPFPAKAPPRA